jgi:hypothetical protein
LGAAARFRGEVRRRTNGKVRPGGGLVRGLARGGIIALVDEATGFRRDRAATALTGRRKHKNFHRLTRNAGYPKLREHLGAVIATMKLSGDWYDLKDEAGQELSRQGKATQLSFGTGKGHIRIGRQLRRPKSVADGR